MIYASAFITNILLILSILLFRNGILEFDIQIYSALMLSLSPPPIILPIFNVGAFAVVYFVLAPHISLHISDDERIKCIHLTDRWEQFKSIPTLSEYELGTLLFVLCLLYSMLHALAHSLSHCVRCRCAILKHLWKTFYFDSFSPPSIHKNFLYLLFYFDEVRGINNIRHREGEKEKLESVHFKVLPFLIFSTTDANVQQVCILWKSRNTIKSVSIVSTRQKIIGNNCQCLSSFCIKLNEIEIHERWSKINQTKRTWKRRNTQIHQEPHNQEDIQMVET